MGILEHHDQANSRNENDKMFSFLNVLSTRKTLIHISIYNIGDTKIKEAMFDIKTAPLIQVFIQSLKFPFSLTFNIKTLTSIPSKMEYHASKVLIIEMTWGKPGLGDARGVRN